MITGRAEETGYHFSAQALKNSKHLQKGKEQETMRNWLGKQWDNMGKKAVLVLSCLWAFAAPVFAQASQENLQAAAPATGDNSVNLMPVMVGLLAVSVVVILVVVILGAKKK